ncbi:MAG: hypothetical protein AAGI54_12140 [Planctomycetota bacterium]
MAPMYVQVGGLVALGVDAEEQYLLTVSHNGLGVFRIDDWGLVCRSKTLAYPEDGFVMGIGPLQDRSIQVLERTQSDTLELKLHRRGLYLFYEDGAIEITPLAN